MKAQIDESVAALRERLGDFTADVAIIFGTGLSSLAQEVEDARSVPYSEIPHFPEPTVESHSGELVCGRLNGRNIVAMKGRFHYYEGYTMQQITLPVRVMHALGAPILITSNAVGGMNPRMPRGDVCIIEDHINLLLGNPLIGPNDESLGPRFPDMSQPYDPELRSMAMDVARKAGVACHEAVYVAVTGPNLETRAEYRFLRMIGADIVGMSTVPEVIVGVHEGMRCLSFSIITDQCLPDALVPVELEEIIATAAEAEPKLNTIVKGVLGQLGDA